AEAEAKAEAAKKKAADEANAAARDKRAADKKEKDRRAAEVLAEREAAKKAEVDAAAENFQLGDPDIAPVVKKVTTEEAVGQKDVFASPPISPETPKTAPSKEGVSASKPRLTASEIPADVTIFMPVKVEETGEIHDVEFNARDAFKESSRRIKRLEVLRACL
ncbi:hypothetical protein UFOVP1297_1, partial [uncultured Caudovirales phage]